MLYQGIIGGGSSPVEPVEPMEPVLLWTNSDVSSGFPAQKISLDLTNYVGVIIEFCQFYGDATKLASRAYIKKTDVLYDDTNIFASGFQSISGETLTGTLARGIKAIDNTGITFGTASNGNVAYDNNNIPTKIYGVQEYVVEPFKPVDATVCERAYTFPATSGTTNTWTVNEDGLYFLTGDAPGISDNRGSISLIGDITLISGSEPVRVFKAKAGAQVKLTVSSGNTFTPYINRIK